MNWHDIFVAYRQHTRHQFSLCLGCLVMLPELILCTPQIRTHSQETLYPNLPIYSVVRDKTVTDHVCVVLTDSALLIGSNVVAIAEQVLISLTRSELGILCLYNISPCCATHQQRCLPTCLACKRSIADLLANCALSCICKFVLEPADHASFRKYGSCITADVTWHELQLLVVAINLLNITLTYIIARDNKSVCNRCSTQSSQHRTDNLAHWFHHFDKNLETCSELQCNDIH